MPREHRSIAKKRYRSWVGLNLFLDPNTTAIEHELTFHFFNHLYYRRLLDRRLLYI